MSLAGALQLLGEVAGDFGITFSPMASTATAVVPVFRPSGKRHDFTLEIFTSGDVAYAREAQPGTLPPFCPDRHINPGGSFCLGWGTTSPSTVLDGDTARAWWSAVVHFLKLQLTASDTRRWANRSGQWAHGDAADHQANAEEAAGRLGMRFQEDLRDGAFSIDREAHARGARLVLRRRGAFTARIVLGPPPRLKDTTVPCPCDARGATVGACGNHADDLATFVVEFWRWRWKEGRFLQDLARSGASCCGTLDQCGLRDAIASHATDMKEAKRREQRHRPRRRPRL